MVTYVVEDKIDIELGRRVATACIEAERKTRHAAVRFSLCLGVQYHAAHRLHRIDEIALA